MPGRTFLQIAQATAARVGIEQPAALFGQTGRNEIELAEAMREGFRRILYHADWGELREVATITGDGATEQFDLESILDSDKPYLRMPANAVIHSPRYAYSLTPVSVEDILRYQTLSFSTPVGVWAIDGTKFYILPVHPVGEVVKFHYIRRPPDPDSDDGTFFLPNDRVLELAATAEYKKLHEMPYEQEEMAYMDAVAQMASWNKGPSVFRTGVDTMSDRAKPAWPGIVPVSR